MEFVVKTGEFSTFVRVNILFVAIYILQDFKRKAVVLVFSKEKSV